MITRGIWHILSLAVVSALVAVPTAAKASIQLTETTPVNWAFKGNGNFTNAELQAFFNVATPVMGTTEVNGFLYVDSDPDNSLYDLDGDTLLNLYKENADTGEEARPFQDSYDTDFYDDAEWATISYTGGPEIATEHAFLIVKDGHSDPNVYVYDLNSMGWDGQEKIQLGSAGDHLFDARGSISHIEIVGGGLARSEEMPEPLSLIVWSVLGAATIGTTYLKQRKR